MSNPRSNPWFLGVVRRAEGPPRKFFPRKKICGPKAFKFFWLPLRVAEPGGLWGGGKSVWGAGGAYGA